MLTIDTSSLKANVDEVMVGQLAVIGVDAEDALVKTENRLVGELIARARAKAGGDVLQVRSGRLLASIQGDVEVENSIHTQRGIGNYFAGGEIAHEGVFAKVFSNDPAAHILEYGGRIPPHEIDPKTAQALRFLGREGIAFAASVQFPGATIAPHSFIHAAFDEMEQEIITDLEAAAGTL